MILYHIISDHIMLYHSIVYYIISFHIILCLLAPEEPQGSPGGEEEAGGGQEALAPSSRLLGWHYSGEEHPCEDKLPEHKIRGRMGVFAAGLQGEGFRKRNVFSQTPVCFT